MHPYRLGFLVGSMDSPIGRGLAASIGDFYGPGRADVDLMMFYREPAAVEEVVMCARFNSTEVYSFSGDVVATDLASAAFLLTCPGPRRKYFYVDHPEWSASRASWTYLDLVKIYRDPRLHILVAPGMEKPFKVWNRPSKTVDIADLGVLTKGLDTGTIQQ